MTARLKGVAWSLASLLALFAVWHLVTRLFDVPWYVLPTPANVLLSLKQGVVDVIARGTPFASQGFLLPTYETLRSAFLGFVIGSTAGIAGGILLAEVRIIERLFLPYIAAFQSLPKVALVPLFIIWFGIGMMSKVMLSAALVFFPVLLNTMNGFREVDRDRLELARSYNASGLQKIRFITLPSALPAIGTGLELGIVYALLGSIAAELVSGNQGIGARLMSQQSLSDTPGMFALLAIAGTIGAVLHLSVRTIKKKVIFWNQG